MISTLFWIMGEEDRHRRYAGLVCLDKEDRCELLMAEAVGMVIIYVMTQDIRGHNGVLHYHKHRFPQT